MTPEEYTKKIEDAKMTKLNCLNCGGDTGIMTNTCNCKKLKQRA